MPNSITKYQSYNESNKSTKVEKLILWSSVATVLGLIQLPYKKIDGNPIPTILFMDNPSLYHAFILSINFSFFGSFMTTSLRDKIPRLAKCCLCLAVVSSSLGVAILSWLAVPVLFKLEGRRLFLK